MMAPPHTSDVQVQSKAKQEEDASEGLNMDMNRWCRFMRDFNLHTSKVSPGLPRHHSPGVSPRLRWWSLTDWQRVSEACL